MRESLELVIIAITLLVAALVILTIFGSSMTPFGWFASSKNLCISEFSNACQATGGIPASWNTPKYKDASSGQLLACSSMVSCTCTPANPPKPAIATCA